MSNNSLPIKILIVEDDIIIEKDIQDMLECAGYTVTTLSSSGKEAIAKVGKIRPNLVLIDIDLKGSPDGVEVAKQIRSRFNIPVVYLIPDFDDNTLKKAESREPTNFILKYPVRETELLNVIKINLYLHKIKNNA